VRCPQNDRLCLNVGGHLRAGKRGLHAHGGLGWSFGFAAYPDNTARRVSTDDITLCVNI
jgi:hypothetical protein